MPDIRTFTIKSNFAIAKDVYEMNLAGDTKHYGVPGQFVNIRLEGFYLRRPISICSWTPGALRLIYKVVGEGTRVLSKMREGRHLELLGPLGNGFSIIEGISAPLLVGGGAGVPPLYGLAQRLIMQDIQPVVALGFNTAEDVFYTGQFRRLGVQVYLSTADGSDGIGGFVTDIPALAEGGFDYYYACGPEPMLRAVYNAIPCPGQLSFEERMACGFGACMGCTCRTVTGGKRICTEGPVLMKEEILWEAAL